MPRKQRSSRRFSVRCSTLHGRGVFALRPIRKGARVVEYVGERISQREADRRHTSENGWAPHTMLFVVDGKTVIDATRKGNSARWINHSCSPNCEAVDDAGRIYIEAIRNIRTGEELTYDYNLVLDEPHTLAAKSAHPCHCGAQRCRGTLLGKKR
ncbi:MAG TPA: SET domain-containing protein-lysine N-methyltransferase [Burkholderiales bacterium]|jgi:SET domain-containing protein